MDGYSYDASGNLLSDGVHTYTYDAENRIVNVDWGSSQKRTLGANTYAKDSIQPGSQSVANLTRNRREKF